MYLYNSLTRTIEPFEPRGSEVNVYTCGITPYDTTHLGHAFTYTSVDILIRYLESLGLKVNYVQNVTDIDDDILRKAREVGENWHSLGNRWTAHFIRDMQALNVRPPDYYPRATDVISEIISTVQRLISTGLGYEADGNVYFHVDRWKEFGKLSRLTRDEMLAVANERGNRPDDPNKRNPLDFVLWQAQAPGEPAWESPWGPGRPGWHIECSVMSTKYLGEVIDIHCGGGDLSFPHHECEIAQVEPISPKGHFVRFWMHIAMVHYQGAKMSKSIGNLIMVRDLLEKWSPNALRLYLGSHHYRDTWSYNEDDLKWAEDLAREIDLALSAESESRATLDAQNFWNSFKQSMDSDLNTSGAIQTITELTRAILAASQRKDNVIQAKQTLKEMVRIFGYQYPLGQLDPRVIEGWEMHLARFI
mgnify:CR=1 FL=1